MDFNGYNVHITMSPLPRSCVECPYYYGGDWEEDCGCLLTPYQISLWGTALERSGDCPLETTDNQYDAPTEKQIEYAKSIAKDKNKELNIAYTKQAYWEFINKNKGEEE